MKKLLVIDGNSLVNRAFYALPGLETKNNIPTGAIHGFLNMLKRIYDEEKPSDLLVTFDAHAKTFRHKKYDFYKANRKSMSDELRVQMPILKEILKSLGIKIIEVIGYEADDIIGTISNIANKNGYETLILSGDKDILQLVNKNTTLAYPKRGVSNLKYYNPETTFKELELRPDQIIDYKALRGDTADNIPGVKGVGEKTATRLLKEYENLNNIYNNLDKIKGRTKTLLINGKENAFISKELATIILDMELDINFEDLKFVGFKTKKSLSLLDEYELNSFKKSLKENITENEEVFIKKFDIDANKDLFIHILNYNDECIYVLKQDYIMILNEEEFKKIKNEVYKTNIVVYNMKYYFEKKLLNTDNFKDVMIENYLVYPDKNSEDIESVLYNYGLNLKYKDIKADKDKLYLYLSNLINSIEKAHTDLTKKIKDNNLFNLYKDIEKPLIKILAKIHSNGFTISTNELDKLDLEISKHIEENENTIYQLSGEKFNINSPKQMAAILFEKLELPVIKKTKTGYSTSKEVLDKLYNQHPIIRYILEYRSYSKLKSTYIDGLRKEIESDGKIHTSLMQTVAVTGRLSSKEPNLQNIPIRTEHGRKIRKVFIASKNNILMSADYSQIELRLLAHMSGDENMIKAFNEDNDIHKITASKVFGVNIEDVTRDQRREAKAVNFGIVYGISDYGLSENIDIPIIKAKDYIDRYFELYPGIKEYMDNIVEFCKENGYVTTYFSRKRNINNINSKNFHIRNFAKRAAMNTPIQGTAADIIKYAMINVDKRIVKENLKAKMILQVHDELIFDLPKEEEEILKEILVEEMENVVDLSIPLIVNIEKGYNWYEL